MAIFPDDGLHTLGVNFCILLIITKYSQCYPFIENYFATRHLSLQKFKMSDASCKIRIFQSSVTLQSSVRASVSLIKISCSDTLPFSFESGINEGGGVSEQLILSDWGERHRKRTHPLLVFSVAFWGLS